MEIKYLIPQLPMYVVDPVMFDISRIRRALMTYHFDCSETQAAAIREAIRPLPFDDDELLDVASEYCFVEWHVAPHLLEPVLRELAQRYRQLEPDKRQILAATRGLTEHPEWWDLPCHCNSCVEDCQ